MSQNNDQTVGNLAYNLLQKDPDTRDPIEIRREMFKDHERNMQEAIEDGCKQYQDSFYIVVLQKREKLMPNAFGLFYVNRHTCPTPQFDQTVYWYDRVKGDIHFLWTVPTQQACIELYYNAHDVPKEQRQLRDFVLDFYDGTLLKKTLQRNNELPE